ncbi:MAG: hypothetical protein RR538_09425 [Erysipelotrichaceae bacterium]
MQTYVKMNDLYNIVYDANYNYVDENVAMERIMELFNNRSGKFSIINGELQFTPNYDRMNYKWSTSVIGSDNEKYKVENQKKLFDAIEEEIATFEYIIDDINNCMKGYPKEMKEMFVRRYINNEKVRFILSKMHISRKYYYKYIEAGEWLFKTEIGIKNPPKQISIKQPNKK